MKELQEKINKVFVDVFKKTPLTQRLNDILGEAIELSRYTDIKNLKEEIGDLLSSTIQLCNECDWDAEELINANLQKILKRSNQYLSLGRKTSVAILGGAFDPVTQGHIEVAQFVLNTSNTFDEVWLMPCYNHIYSKKMVDANIRLELCNLAVQQDRRIKVFDYEIKKKLGGETYHFVKNLLDEDFAKNEFDFSLIIGMDNANTFESWVNYKELERLIRFVVVPRKGEIQNNKTWYLNLPHIYLPPDNENIIREISSTKIRTLIKTKSYALLHDDLYPPVFEKIKELKLYEKESYES